MSSLSCLRKNLAASESLGGEPANREPEPLNPESSGPPSPSCFCLVVLVACALFLGRPTPALAQAPKVLEAQGGFPDAAFETLLRLYTPPANAFSPYFAWDAHMATGVTLYRKGQHEMLFGSVFQSVGTESIRSRVSVGGTGYIITLGYARRRSDSLTISAGVTHMSSHLTRDLDEKLNEQRSKAVTVPSVEDPDEYNVPFVGWRRTWSAARSSPQLHVVVEPTHFRFNGTWAWNGRPIFIATQWTLWRGIQKSLVVETQHELGVRPFTNVFLLLELFARGEPEGRLQVFLSGSPGHGLHVSPNIGGLRDGVAFGMRMKFRG